MNVTPQEIADGAEQLRANMLQIMGLLTQSIADGDPMAGVILTLGGLAAGIDVVTAMVGDLAKATL